MDGVLPRMDGSFHPHAVVLPTARPMSFGSDALPEALLGALGAMTPWERGLADVAIASDPEEKADDGGNLPACSDSPH